MMIRSLSRIIPSLILVVSVCSLATPSAAQDSLPRDSSADLYGEYHPSPAYRESESHPLRILAYIVHPIGWLAREVIFRPFSYFASSTPETRAIMGYREPHDFRRPSCFSKIDSVPDCRQVKPFDYADGEAEGNANDDLDQKIKEALESK